MPRVYEDVIEVDNKPCGSIRDDLKACLLATDCVKIHKMTPKECLLSRHPTIPDECIRLRILLFECKRSLLDNRQRFRGRKGT